MGRHRAASSNYSLCSQAFAALHSLFVSCSFFIHFHVPPPPPISSSRLSVWLCVFSSPRVFSSFFPFFSIFAFNYLFFSVRDFLVWFALSLYSRLFFSFKIYYLPLPWPPFRMIFAATGTFLSQCMAISVNFG